MFTKIAYVGYPYDTTLLSNKGKPTAGSETSWMYIKYIELNEKVQTQEVMYFMFAFTWHSGKGKFINSENRLVVPGVYG